MTTALTVVEPTSIPASNLGTDTGKLLGSTACHQVVYMQNKIGCDSGYSRTVRDSIEWPMQLGMPLDKISDIFDLSPGARKRFLVFHFRLRLGLSQCHLDAAVGVDLS